MAMTLLPRFFVLESGGRYLSLTENQSSASVPSGFLKFDEEQIWSPRVKFEVERAKSVGVQEMVHIRSCYNNKYWEVLPAAANSTRVISASGEKPEEDRSKESCTLFKIHSALTSNTAVRLQFVQNGMDAGRLLPNSVYNVTIHGGMTVSDEFTNNGLSKEFNVTNWETLVILPKEVSFKSEELDGNYLCSRILDRRYPYQRFESGLDVGDPLVAKELFPTPNGNYRIKDMHFGKFWRLGGNWIWADAEEDSSNNNDTLFSIVKISDTVMGLRNLGNNRFCGAVTKEGKTDCLNADYPTISRQTRLMIEERVLHREISDIKYRLSDSRIYQDEIQEVAHAFANNNSPTDNDTITLNYKITESRTSHWTNSVSTSVGVAVSFEVSIIPIIAKGEVEVTTEFSYSHEWGVSKTTEITKEVSYVVTVPPFKTIKVTLMATKAACDVPFSYTQTDLLTTGERVLITKDDGVYTGINSYNFNFSSQDVTKDAQGRVFF
ncbi:uncharacterized protein [Rutidosis leptorrhynchoides]|uniref:uncharacterized protein n=1 Tax=Rutidosis leptorrhynchoides TaxID=125765 RepID=UPI003A9A484E